MYWDERGGTACNEAIEIYYFRARDSRGKLMNPFEFLSFFLSFLSFFSKLVSWILDDFSNEGGILLIESKFLLILL